MNDTELQDSTPDTSEENGRWLADIMEELRLEDEKYRAMLNRCFPKKGKHRHVWMPVGRAAPITKPLKLGKKYSTKIWECSLCGATKYKYRNEIKIVLPARE